jgi:hypothetical protein
MKVEKGFCVGGRVDDGPPFVCVCYYSAAVGLFRQRLIETHLHTMNCSTSISPATAKTCNTATVLLLLVYSKYMHTIHDILPTSTTFWHTLHYNFLMHNIAMANLCVVVMLSLSAFSLSLTSLTTPFPSFSSASTAQFDERVLNAFHTGQTLAVICGQSARECWMEECYLLKAY